jgi:hypothetical protein
MLCFRSFQWFPFLAKSGRDACALQRRQAWSSLRVTVKIRYLGSFGLHTGSYSFRPEIFVQESLKAITRSFQFAHWPGKSCMRVLHQLSTASIQSTLILQLRSCPVENGLQFDSRSRNFQLLFSFSAYIQSSRS